MLEERELSRIHAVISECHELVGLTEFKTFIRKKIRPILPHRIAVCGLGEARTRRVLRLITTTVDLGCHRHARGLQWDPPGTTPGPTVIIQKS